MEDSNKYTFTLPVGTILTGGKNSYRIEEVLGQGGYGITYKVWAIIKNGQIPVKVPFAIKEHFVNGRCHRAADGVTVEYSQEAAEDVEESLRDFVKEGQLLHRICQTDDEAVKFIVPVNEVIEANNTAYFVMQYLEGGSLRRMVLAGQGGLSEDNALALIKPIARAVDFIHSHKVLHMDIKPENIVMHRNLLTGQQEPVLIDFGVSLHFNKKGGLTSKHTSFGHTEGFSPIEQYGAVETFAPWIDVYALGATLYYLLTGKTPPKAFDMTPDDVDRNLPSAVSKRTKVAIKHAMAKEHQSRTQTASTFLWELENYYEPVKLEDADKNVTIKKKAKDKPLDKYELNAADKMLLKQSTEEIGKNGKIIGQIVKSMLTAYSRLLLSRLLVIIRKKYKRIGGVILLLVVILGAYMQFGPKSSQNVVDKREILIADSIEKARKDSIERARKDSIAMEETKIQREKARQDSIDEARRDSVKKSIMEEAAHQNETGNKPQKESKAEVKREKKEKEALHNKEDVLWIRDRDREQQMQ